MEKENLEEYKKIFLAVKQQILTSQYRAMQVVNRELIFMYWNIGKIILENEKWGNKFIEKLSIDLKQEFPETKGFSIRNLKYMRKFAKEYYNFEFVQQVVAQIPWGHNVVLMDKTNSIEQRQWYMNQCIKNGWSKNMLRTQIDNKLYERQAIAEKTTNFSSTLPNFQSDLAIQTIKDPYIFNFITLKENPKELEIEQAIINKIKDVLIEFGSGFAFIGNQYKIEIDKKDYYIDLLFYHLKLKCYFVVELKAREFEPIDIGQISFYLSAIDNIVKDKNDNPTIGLILCKKKNKFIAEYALKDINKPIGISEYKMMNEIPEYLEKQLPNVKDIEMHLNYQ